MRALIGKLKGARRLPALAAVALLAAAALLYLNASGAGGATGAAATPLEQRMASVLGAIDGAGRVRVLLRERSPAPAQDGADARPVDGAVVVAEGAGDIRTALSLQRAVKALLGVPLERIEVLAMDEKGG